MCIGNLFMLRFYVFLEYLCSNDSSVSDSSGNEESPTIAQSKHVMLKVILLLNILLDVLLMVLFFCHEMDEFHF